MPYKLKYSGQEIDELLEQIKDKVDKINGKGLSKNDFTDYYKNILDNIYTVIDKAVSSALDEFDAPKDDRLYARCNGKWVEIKR